MEKVHSLILGSLIGDGYMSCKTHAYLKICHSINQKEYVDWKYTVLAPFVKSKPKQYQGNGSRIGYRFCTLSLPIFTDYYYQFYDKNRHKFIPDHLQLTPFALAIWFMDDGAQNRTSVYFNTQQFSLRDQFKLLSALHNQYGIDGNLNKDKQYFRIRLFKDGAQILKNLIFPHVPHFMKYKFPL